MLYATKWCANQSLYVANVMCLSWCCKRNCLAFLISPACSSNSVNIVRGIIWQIVIYYQFNVRYINTTRGDVCSNKYLVGSSLKSFERFATLWKRSVGVYFSCSKIVFIKCACNLFCTMLGTRKDQKVVLL